MVNVIKIIVIIVLGVLTHTVDKTVYLAQHMSRVLRKWNSQLWSYVVCWFGKGLRLIQGKAEAKVGIPGNKVERRAHAAPTLPLRRLPTMETPPRVGGGGLYRRLLLQVVASRLQNLLLGRVKLPTSYKLLHYFQPLPLPEARQNEQT